MDRVYDIVVGDLMVFSFSPSPLLISSPGRIERICGMETNLEPSIRIWIGVCLSCLFGDADICVRAPKAK